MPTYRVLCARHCAECSASLASLVPILRFCVVILFILSVSTLFPRLQKHCHNPCVTPASLELYLMGFASSALQVHKLGRGKVQLPAAVQSGEAKADTDLDPSTCSFCCIHRQTETRSSQRRRETCLNSRPLCMMLLGPGIASRTGRINGRNQQTAQVAFLYLACPGADKRRSVTLAAEMSLVAKRYWL